MRASMSNLLYADLGDKVPEVPVYEITNVWNYVIANGFSSLDRYGYDDETKMVDVTTLDNIFPPFPSFWMEYGFESGARSAVLWKTFQKLDGWDFVGNFYWDDGQGNTALVPLALTIAIDKGGKPSPQGFGTKLLQAKLPEDGVKQLVISAEAAAFLTFIALSFLNMHKNSVTVVENPPSR
jgi:hypothetical protein